MALADGTNCGFVSSAPVDDPAGTAGGQDTYAVTSKYASPVGNNVVTSMGWWCNTASEEANFEMGIYSHDADNNKPNLLLASNQTNAKGTTAGWKTSSVSYSISASTVYWLATQLDDTVTTTQTDRATDAAYLRDYKSAITLPSPWGASNSPEGYYVAYYALYEAGGAPSAAPRGYLSTMKGYW